LINAKKVYHSTLFFFSVVYLGSKGIELSFYY